ncbi:dimethylarginine dimethylaminohydrolase family protein [Gemmatimonadota bacterium]
MRINEGGRLKRVAVCAPGDEYFNVKDLPAHNINEPVDPDLTDRQHANLRMLLEEAGAEVVNLPEAAGHPNSIFTRDSALIVGDGYVRVRMGLASRQGETLWMSDHLDGLGYHCIGEIEEPGTLEGGDVIMMGDVAFAGLSCRTNQSGIEQLSTILSGTGVELRVAPVADDAMHIGGVMSAIGSRRVLCCAGRFPDGFLEGFDTVETAFLNPSSGNVICLGENKVVVNIRENGVTASALAGQGVTVLDMDLSEFRKGAGGPTCLILPLERD